MGRLPEEKIMGELILEELGVMQLREHMCDSYFYVSTCLGHGA